MRVLLDTHAFLWWIEDTKIGARARAVIMDPDNTLVLSLVSIWEIAIKASLGKLKLPTSFEHYIPRQLQLNRITQLGIDFRHVARVATLPFHHRDPSIA